MERKPYPSDVIYKAKQVFEAKSVKQASYSNTVPRTRKSDGYFVPEIIKISLSGGVDRIFNGTL